MVELKAILQTYHMDVLKEIARTLGLSLDQKTLRKASLVDDIDRAVPKLARSRAFVDTLQEVERVTLAIALEKDEPLLYGDLAMRLMLTGLVYIEGQPGNRNKPTVDDVLTGLLRKGLLVNLSETWGSSTLRTLVSPYRLGLPTEVRRALATTLRDLPVAKPEGLYHEPSPPARTATRDTRQFLRELLFCWSELRQQPARQLKAGGMSKRDRRRLATALGLEEVPGLVRVDQLYDVLQALNLVSEDGTNVTAVDTHAATLFWGTGQAQLRRDLLRAYLQLNAPLNRDSEKFRLYGYYQGDVQRPDSEIRRRVLDTLERSADLGWLPYPLFLKFLTASRAGGLILNEEALQIAAQHLRWYGSEYRRDANSSVQEYEQLIARAAIDELHTLGFVDIGYREADDTVPTAIRAAPELRTASEDRSRPRAGEEPPWQIILQPDFQMLALGPVPLRTLANLERFAAREKIDESVITYRLTRERAYQALQHGETVASIIAYLQEATELPVPQNIERSLQAWGQQFERIVVRRSIRVLQVDKAEILHELMVDPELSARLHTLDDCTAWFRPEDITKIQERLRYHEILPAQSHGAEADLPNSLRWHGDELASRTALPSLYVVGTLHRIAASQNGRWQLTPESVQRAAARGSDPLSIIAQLEQMTGRPLPAGWQKRLKSWGRHFGNGQSAEVRLLRLKQRGALEELRNADQDLHRWLRPLPGVPDLAVVSEPHWEEVITLLNSWGVEIAQDRWW